MLDAWTAEVAELTAGWREKRARECMLKVKDIKTPKTTALWHRQRARGHRERFDRVGDCQRVETVEIVCGHCSHRSTRGARCRCALACVSCRGKISHEKRAKLAANRRTAIDLAQKRGLMRERRRGRWSEKLVTLTLPHFAELGVIERIRFVGECWRAFARSLNEWIKTHPDCGYVDRQGHRLARWFRSLEWTVGEGDELGHPHVHFWFFGPYLPGGRATDDPRASTIRNMWRDAIRQTATRTKDLAEHEPKIGPKRYPRRPAPVPPAHAWREAIEGLDKVVCDVRAIRPGPESLREVIKYLFKDTGRYGSRRLDPETWACVYQGFDGARTTQGSRGLMSLAAREHAMTGYVYDPVTGELRDVELADLPELRIGAVCPCCKTRPVEGWHVVRRPMTEAERLALDARAGLRKAAGGKKQRTFYEGQAIA